MAVGVFALEQGVAEKEDAVAFLDFKGAGEGRDGESEKKEDLHEEKGRDGELRYRKMRAGLKGIRMGASGQGRNPAMPEVDDSF
jgi:hypothetical protein